MNFTNKKKGVKNIKTMRLVVFSQIHKKSWEEDLDILYVYLINI